MVFLELVEDSRGPGEIRSRPFPCHSMNMPRRPEAQLVQPANPIPESAALLLLFVVFRTSLPPGRKGRMLCREYSGIPKRSFSARYVPAM